FFKHNVLYVTSALQGLAVCFENNVTAGRPWSAAFIDGKLRTVQASLVARAAILDPSNHEAVIRQVQLLANVFRTIGECHESDTVHRLFQDAALFRFRSVVPLQVARYCQPDAGKPPVWRQPSVALSTARALGVQQRASGAAR